MVVYMWPRIDYRQVIISNPDKPFDCMGNPHWSVSWSVWHCTANGAQYEIRAGSHSLESVCFQDIIFTAASHPYKRTKYWTLNVKILGHRLIDRKEHSCESISVRRLNYSFIKIIHTLYTLFFQFSNFSRLLKLKGIVQTKMKI